MVLRINANKNYNSKVGQRRAETKKFIGVISRLVDPYFEMVGFGSGLNIQF